MPDNNINYNNKKRKNSELDDKEKGKVRKLNDPLANLDQRQKITTSQSVSTYTFLRSTLSLLGSPNQIIPNLAIGQATADSFEINNSNKNAPLPLVSLPQTIVGNKSELKQKFDYEYFADKAQPIIDMPSFYTKLRLSNYIFLRKIDIHPFNSYKDVRNIEIGWKVHITLDEGGNNLQRAWNIVKDIAIENNLACMKLTENLLYNHPEPAERGKHIVIAVELDNLYWLDKGKELRNWTEFFQTIHDKFLENDIAPGPHYEHGAFIEGSEFFSYRNDANELGRGYVSEKEAKEFARQYHTLPFNPFQKENPLADIKIEQNRDLTKTFKTNFR